MNDTLADAFNALNFLHDPGTVFELCIMAPEKNFSPLWTGRVNGKKSLVVGWYDDPEAAAKIALQVCKENKPAGIYTTLNPCKRAIHARAENKLKAGIERTADAHIDRLKNLLIDVDVDGVSGVSGTDAEHEMALEMAQIIQADLSKEGWPEPMPGDSGNGGHLIYPIDLPNTPENIALLKDVLTALALRYKEELIRRNLGIDTAVFNPGRLTKLYGTWVRKGDSTATRPHRLARVLSLPEVRRPVPLELLQKLAKTVPKQEAKAKPDTGTGEGRLDVAAYLAHYGIKVVKEKPHQGGTLYCLETCLFNPDHTGNEAAIGQAADGKLFYQCFHNSCKGKAWHDARRIISGEDKLAPFMVGGPYYSERESYRGTGVCGDLVKAIREGTLTPGQKAYLIDIIGKLESNRSIAEEVREWVLTSNGLFLTSDCFTELGLTSRDFKKAATLELLRLKKKGVIEPCGDRRGCYRLVENVATEIPWKEVGIPTPVDLKLPLDLHDLVYFYSGNIVVVGGTYNAGKTVFCLNTAHLNMSHWKVTYFSSEMTPEELAARLHKFKNAGLIPNMDAWDKVSFKQRRDNFHQVIDPDGLNIIDYLELTKEFYAVGGLIDQIFGKLDKGIAVIAIQKAPDEIHPRGGAFTMEKARFGVSIDYQSLKIIKAKNLRPGAKNPTNSVIGFHVADGTKMIRTS